MALSTLIGQLKSIGQMLNRWLAQFRLMVGLSAIVVLFFCLALADFMTRYTRHGRFMAWGVLLALTAVLVVLIMKTLARRRAPEAVAANVEQAFPELDNHLINFLQFSAVNAKDSFVKAYIKMEIPHWSSLDFRVMRDKRTLRHAQIALALAVLLLLLPFPFLGRAWSVAMVRVLNPFAEITPLTLSRVVSVSPGDTVVVQGGDVNLMCQAEGKAGHAVHLDLRPSDGEQKSYNLGSLKGGAVESFSHSLPRVTTATKYRFRVGDGYVRGWKTIDLRPPLAFNEVQLEVIPPAYMGLSPQKYDAHATAIDIPYGSTLSVSAECNTGLNSLSLAGTGLPVKLNLDHGSKKGLFEIVVTNGAALTVTAVDMHGDSAETTLGFNLLLDHPPILTIKYPRAPVVLPAGSAPTIDFAVADDVGIGEITIEQIFDKGAAEQTTEVIKTYSRDDNRGRELTYLWRGDIRKASDSGTLVFQVRASDNSVGIDNVTLSPALIFELDADSAAAKQRDEEAKSSAAALSRVIELQRDNIVKTRELQTVLNIATPEQWSAAAEQQETIRNTVKLLIEKGGARALGNLVTTVKKLYVHEMYEVIPALRGVPGVSDQNARVQRVARIVAMQEKILRQLTAAGKSAKMAEKSHSADSLMGRIDGIISGQRRIITTTSRCSTQDLAIAESVIDDQDALSSEVILFVKACRTQAKAGAGEDKAQADFLNNVATFCEQRKITDDMLLSAEQLEENELKQALVHQRSAYAKLISARKEFERVKASEEKETREEMIEALQIASAKLSKLKAVEKRLREEMDKIEEISNANTEDFDIMEEAASEIKKNIEDALLEIPRDLDIFTHLNVGNDLVEDVYSVFEELDPDKDSGEKNPDGTSPVEEKAVAKREWYLDEMEKAEELLEDFEMWLGKDADTTKVTTEAFDKEEMPEGVALTPLQSSMEDIIGDLLDIDKDLDKEADDGAINQALPDMIMGAEITEGDTTTFSAKGKSGNETPDHKEQDGRSNVGRQGMASGESAAGSGTIGEGDDDIEARRTKDPTQSGQVIAEGEADTKATGGGKLGSGKGDDWGDSGGTDRMDSSEAGSWAQNLDGMARKADQAYAQASLKGLRTESLESAAHHIRQAADAVSRGVPISQISELRRKAIGALKKAKTELGEGAVANLDGHSSESTLTDVVEAGQERSPEKYKELNADYYKKLNATM